MLGSRYLGIFLSSKEDLEAWVQHHVEAWDQRIRTLAKIAKRNPQLAYAVLGISLQLECHYLKITVPRVGPLMRPINESLI